MKSSAPYRDERLSLRGLAELLGVEPRQLSYHLHTHLCLSFRDYVNEWRLKAVCRALLEDPGRAILGTAFANGFNSKSSFNTLFFERYGMTPRQFKKNADV
jgi:transcriptional regulator GlxA family with amidase domain